MKKDNLQTNLTSWYRDVQRGYKNRLFEQYLGRILVSCGGAESVQQAQAALCVRVGNLAA